MYNVYRLWHYVIKTICRECYTMVVSFISQIMITHQLALLFVWLSQFKVKIGVSHLPLKGCSHKCSSLPPTLRC